MGVKLIHDPQTGIVFVKISDGQKNGKRLKGAVSYWSTSLLTHDRDDGKRKSELVIVK